MCENAQDDADQVAAQQIDGQGAEGQHGHKGIQRASDKPTRDGACGSPGADGEQGMKHGCEVSPKQARSQTPCPFVKQTFFAPCGSIPLSGQACSRLLKRKAARMILEHPGAQNFAGGVVQ
jgi:hypothetical protein